MYVNFEKEVQKYSVCIDFFTLKESLSSKAKEMLDVPVSQGGTDPSTLFELFGSHVVTSVQVGQKLIYCMQVDTSSFQSQKDVDVAINVGMKHGFFGAAGNINADDKKHLDQLLSSATSSTKQKGCFSYQTADDLAKFNTSLPKVSDCVPIGFANGLIPIWEFCSDSARKEELKKGFIEYAKSLGCASGTPEELHRQDSLARQGSLTKPLPKRSILDMIKPRLQHFNSTISKEIEEGLSKMDTESFDLTDENCRDPAFIEDYYTYAVAMNHLKDKLASYKKARILYGGRGTAIYLIRKLVHPEADVAVLHTTKEESLAAKARLEKIEPNLKINWYFSPTPLQAADIIGNDSDFICMGTHMQQLTDEYSAQHLKDGGALFAISNCKRPQGRALIFDKKGKNITSHVLHNLME